MQNSRVMSLHGITDSKWLTKIINLSRKNPEAARRPHVNENPCNYTTFQRQPSVWKCYSSRFCFFFPPGSQQFPTSLCRWDEPGRGPSLDQTWPLTHQYITTLSGWQPPSFESLSPVPTLVHCHQTALDQRKRGLRGIGDLAEHVTGHPSERMNEQGKLKGMDTEPLSTKTKIYLDGKSFELLT